MKIESSVRGHGAKLYVVMLAGLFPIAASADFGNSWPSETVKPPSSVLFVLNRPRRVAPFARPAKARGSGLAMSSHTARRERPLESRFQGTDRKVSTALALLLEVQAHGIPGR
jgi:hypothetical protein